MFSECVFWATVEHIAALYARCVLLWCFGMPSGRLFNCLSFQIGTLNCCMNNLDPRTAFSCCGFQAKVCQVALYCTCHRFMDGGWPVLNAWLAEAKKKQDFAVLVEVLQVCVCACVCVHACAHAHFWENNPYGTRSIVVVSQSLSHLLCLSFSWFGD